MAGPNRHVKVLDDAEQGWTDAGGKPSAGGQEDA
jgi:hypothetical protein